MRSVTGKNWIFEKNDPERVGNTLYPGAHTDTVNVRKLHLCFDYQYIKNGLPKRGKKFHMVDNWMELAQLMESMDEERRNFYEVIFGYQGCKMYYDLDISRERDPRVDLEYANNVRDSVVEATIQVYKEIGASITPADFIVCTSHGVSKFSYHIIVEKYYLRTNVERKEIYARVKELVPTSYGIYIDCVYGGIQQMRIAGCQKLKSGRVKVLNYNWIYRNTLVRRKKNPKLASRPIWDALYQTLITLTHGCEALVVNIPVKNPGYIDGEDFSDIDKDILDAFLAKHPTLKCASRLGRYITLSNIGGYHCPKCNTTHDNENPWIGKFNGHYWFNCRRSSSGISIGSYIEEEKVPEVPRNIVKHNGKWYWSKYIHPFNVLEEEIDTSWMDQRRIVNRSEHAAGMEILKMLKEKELGVDKDHKMMCTMSVDYIYESKYVKDVTMDRGVLMTKSYLGTGKTYAICKYLRENPGLKVLALSPRRIFARSLCGELSRNSGRRFTCYLEDKDDWDIESLVIQVESLFRIEDEYGFASKYDVLILDEIESILTQFSSGSTMRGKVAWNARTFEDLVRKTPLVLCADAFLGPKSTMVMKLIRNDVRVEVNTVKPTPRRSVQFQNTGPLVKTAISQLKNGKKIVFVFASKYKMDMFLQDVRKEGIKYLAYSSATDDKEKSKLYDVNEIWSDPEVRLVCYTSTITVGVNFDVKGVFDSLFVYGSCSSSTVRDIFQGTMRVRHLNDNVMYYSLYTNPIGNGKWPTTSTNRVVIGEHIRKHMNDLDEMISRYKFNDMWEDEVTWLFENHVFNIQESNMDRFNYTTNFMSYIKNCGYGHDFSNTGNWKHKVDLENPKYSDIKCDNVEEVLFRVSRGQGCKLDKLIQAKHQLDQVLGPNVTLEKREEHWKKWIGPGKRKYRSLLWSVFYENAGQTHKDKYIRAMDNVQFKSHTTKYLVRYSHLKDLLEKYDIRDPLRAQHVDRAHIERVTPSIYSLIHEYRKRLKLRIQIGRRNKYNVVASLLKSVLREYYGTKVNITCKRIRTDKGRISVPIDVSVEKNPFVDDIRSVEAPTVDQSLLLLDSLMPQS